MKINAQDIQASLKKVEDKRCTISKDILHLLELFVTREPIPMSLVSSIQCYIRQRLQNLQKDIGRQVAENEPVGTIGTFCADLEGLLSILEENLCHLTQLKEELCRSCAMESSHLDLAEAVEIAYQKLGELCTAEIPK